MFFQYLLVSFFFRKKPATHCKKMIMGQVLPPNTLHTTLNYYLTPENGGTKVFYPGTAGNYRRKHDPHDVDVFDIREASETIEVDRQGFQLVRHSSLNHDLSDVDFVKTKVYEDTAELLKKSYVDQSKRNMQ